MCLFEYNWIWGTREKVISKCFCLKKEEKRSIWFLSAQKYFPSEKTKTRENVATVFLSRSLWDLRNLLTILFSETYQKHKQEVDFYVYNELTSYALEESAQRIIRERVPHNVYVMWMHFGWRLAKFTHTRSITIDLFLWRRRRLFIQPFCCWMNWTVRNSITNSLFKMN